MAETTPTSKELIGWFWSLDENARKLPGTLRMESDGSMRLRIINQSSSLERAKVPFDMPLEDPLRPWYQRDDDQRLVGLVSGTTGSGRSIRDEAVTLDGCRCLTFGVMAQPREVKFTVETAYIGIALRTGEELATNYVGCRAEGIEGWLNPGGPKLSERKFLEPSGEIETTADVAGLGPIAVRMIGFRGFKRDGNTVEVRESGYFTLETEEPVGWEVLSECLYSVCRFLRFALNAPCVVESVTTGVGEHQVEVIEDRMRHRGRKAFRSRRVPWEALFTADERERDVVGSAGAVLRRWLELPSGAKGTLLRLDALMRGGEFVENQVVAVCGATELWYTKLLRLDGERDADLVEPIDASVRREIRERLVNHGWKDVYERRIAPVLAAPNELSTAEKVRRVFDPIEREVMGLAPERPCVIAGKLLRLRHPLSHGGVSEMNVAEVASVIRKSRAILKVAVLDYLGVEWRTVVKYNRTLRWELGLDESWHALPYPVAENDGEEGMTEEAP